MADKEAKNTKSENSIREEKILAFWREHKTFEKSLDPKTAPLGSVKGEFVFYEGPPTANGKPGIHHLEARAFKDAIPRYKTMQGYHVRRKGGWDTHGLPVELQVEKKLGLNSKKAIEEYGIAKFNKECKENVWEYLEFWNKFTERIGYWVDQKDPYVTYHNSYIESVWNVVKKIDEQNLLYKDYKVVPWCPRCGTALSSHELAQGYSDVKDLSIIAKFKIVGFKDAYFLAWTTTPWTLPGNVALAVGADITYVEIKVVKENAGEKTNEILVLAKDRLSIIEGEYEIIAEHKGSSMAGMQYEPLFPYLQNILKGNGEDTEKAFKVYVADFVNTEDGTGIVHTAVMYGADDFDLGTKVGLPKLHLVNPEGNFIDGTDFLAGRFVKEKDENNKPTLDVDIIKYLQEKNLFFKKELYEHSYPHCWRCKTALVYYARDSWYIRMTEPKIKEALVKENEKISWEPNNIKEGRFGEWLAGIKDWAISRERYWGTPLPVWLSLDGEKIIADSVSTIKNLVKKSGNKYFVMRHGGTEGNASDTVSFKNESNDNLTEKGIQQVRSEIGHYKGKVDMVICSPFARTRETAAIVCEELGLGKENLIIDERLHEINPGIFDGKNWNEYHDYVYNKDGEWFTHRIEGGESFQEVGKRVGEALYEAEQKYQNKNILFITHGGPAWLFYVVAGEYLPENKEYQKADKNAFVKEFKRFQNAEIRELNFAPLPHNDNFELDLHRPYIDTIILEKDGKEYKRTKEVMDVWFDSGAMPFAQDHYPFENKELVDGVGFPADYISEAIDQTRGWFYTLHAIGVLMGRGNAYKNVICLGHILDDKGKKMSKSLGNIVDPWIMMEKYGVDTLRLWMYSVNQPGESKNFDEKTVALLNQQVFGLLYNVLSFYEIYRDKDLENNENIKSENLLDLWILARYEELNNLAQKNLDNYKLLEPVRAIREFVGDLSTWYLRRSRDRIKDEDKNARQTLYFVLKNLAKILAPFAPFSAEDIWQKLKNKEDEESVHLASWPESKKVNDKIITDMSKVRDMVSSGLQLRQKAGIPVRQPLASFQINEQEIDTEYLEIIKDELNVKDVVKGQEISIDLNITPELKQEGIYREIVRGVQDMRKEIGLIPSDIISLYINTDKTGQEIVNKFLDDMLKTVGSKEVIFTENDGIEIKIGEQVFKIKIQK